jgi:outer membrane receptor protein involved in Fe transport
LTIGYDFQDSEEDIINDSSFSGMAEFDLEKESHGYYVHNEISITDSFLISGGYRHDRAEFAFDPSTPNDLTLDEDAFTAGVNCIFYKKSYAYFSYSKSFRYPVLDELFSFIGNTINTSLIPQHSDDYEIGVRHYFTDSLYSHVNLFRIDTHDEIFYNPVSIQNDNHEAKTRRDGVEISFGVQPYEWLALSGGYSYIDATVKGGQFKDSDIPTVPNHKATLETVFALGKGLTLSLNGIYIGERPFNSDFTNSFENQEDYVIINSKLKYQRKNLAAFLDINNLTDKEYSEFGTLSLFDSPVQKAFYPSPEINFLFGVSVEI